MGMLDWAKKELDLAGMTEDAEPPESWMREHLLKMVEVFVEEGHSNFSASYAASCLNKLLQYEPLTPLTGRDEEWVEVSEGVWQNKRCYRLFKTLDEGAYDTQGVVFYDTYIDEEGIERKSHYTCKESRTPVAFPYTPHTEYRARPSPVESI